MLEHLGSTSDQLEAVAGRKLYQINDVTILNKLHAKVNTGLNLQSLRKSIYLVTFLYFGFYCILNNRFFENFLLVGLCKSTLSLLPICVYQWLL